jgi:hypothetical protein
MGSDATDRDASDRPSLPASDEGPRQIIEGSRMGTAIRPGEEIAKPSDYNAEHDLLQHAALGPLSIAG